jgi:hypothetical protein
MSSRCGQVVYPAFFESSDFMGKGYLQLCVFPGSLHMKGMRFDSLVDENRKREKSIRGSVHSDRFFNAEDSQKFRCPTTFVSPRPTHAPHASLCWRISVREDCLLGSLRLERSEGTVLDAWNLLQTLCCLLLTPPCEHEPNSPAGDLAQRFHLDRMPTRDTSKEDSSLLLFSAGRDYQRQLSWLYTYCVFCSGLSEGRDLNRVVLHAEGCIRCALELCLDSGAKVVIS